jgi:dTDP-4-amino-4,6-dideoxygalactose transaminase
VKPLRSGYVQGQPAGGPECEAFERELEAYYGVPYARVFNSGTAALTAAVIARRLTAMCVPAIGMSASAASVVYAGALLGFADVDDSYDAKVASMKVHLFGHHHPGTAPIHDCAQSPTLRPVEGQGSVWCYSLNQHKIIQCGEGGYALTFSREIADRLHLVRNHGESVSPDILGHNFRMTELQASVVRFEFAQLDRRIAARRDWAATIAQKYDLPPDPGNMDWYLYPVRVKKNREAFAKRIPGARVGYQPPICDMPWFKAHGYGGKFPNARRIESEIVIISPEAYGL